MIPLTRNIFYLISMILAPLFLFQSISLSGKKRGPVEMYLLAATEKRKERSTNVRILSEKVAMRLVS